jgi:SAM-dependent methyltransferase
VSDSVEARLSHILENQRFCDRFLAPIANPAGKDVLVVGCGAGTEMLWCVRHGARSVIGIDVTEQDPAAFRQARKHLGVNPACTAAINRLAVEDSGALERRFDLVLSANVFEHLADPRLALAECAARLAPNGRIAIFSAPLFYSSTGSHLTHEPWRHLWDDLAELRRSLERDRELPARAAEFQDLEAYFQDGITLNRYRFIDFVEAIRASGLVILRLTLLPDRNLDRLAQYLPQVRRMLGDSVSVQDLTSEGIGIRLARPVDRGLRSPGDVGDHVPVAMSTDRTTSSLTLGELQSRIEILEQENERLVSLIRSVERSLSFRVGRALSLPLRMFRRFASRGRRLSNASE